MDPLYVTKTFLPPFEEYCELLRRIWATHLVTNDGPLYQQFEQDLRTHTRLDNLACVGNGTLALQIALRALNVDGADVLTTPFTHVASSDCLIWEQCNPVYVDIDPETLNIDPDKIEAKITERTAGIIPVHVYSNPCDIEKIDTIATEHDLKVIYDAAHAFGAEYKGDSVLAHGDISMASFNATKGMHAVEGGALFARNSEIIKEIRKLAYYGMDERKQITQRYGTNAKLIEFCAAMGIIVLRYFDEAVERKKHLYELYVSLLEGNDRIRFQKLTDRVNYSYMPIILESEDYKRAVLRELNEHKIYPREYFYPSLETIFKSRIECEIAYDISHRVLCLPMSDYLEAEQVRRICRIINDVPPARRTRTQRTKHGSDLVDLESDTANRV
ncbi:MAG: DegT/DnrJ/EryC1/StrS family aminotransferase [Planctomycetota bacterium]|jgi:dTDP-4-amino-4,6-dideoxygalactose transaminase